MTSRLIFGAVAALAFAGATLAQEGGETAPDQGEGMQAESSWLPSLITETPEEGFALALML